ncbi:hypothetical protein [Streptomyces sp. NPDC058632]|uniref:hypothetical protein n=1 Tax=Streptomyces sp. NPDC058632 TaxID=3346567 RepID=UPI003666CE34
MVSHVEQAIAARIAAVRARREQQAADRAAFAEQRAHGLQARRTAKLRRLSPAASGPGQLHAQEDWAALTGQTAGMTDDNVIPREQAFAAARVAFDRALDRITRDYYAGRLTLEATARIAAAAGLDQDSHRAAEIAQRGDEIEQSPRGDADE